MFFLTLAKLIKHLISSWTFEHKIGTDWILHLLFYSAHIVLDEQINSLILLQKSNYEWWMVKESRILAFKPHHTLSYSILLIIWLLEWKYRVLTSTLPVFFNTWMNNTKWYNGFYIEFGQSFTKETFSYDEHLKS